MGRRLAFVTGNQGKVAELQALLGPEWLVEADKRGYPEIQTDALAKVCRAGAEHLLAAGLRPPFVLEDSGLFVHHLKGFPGVYSRHAQDTIGCAGILRLLEGIPAGVRGAHFETCLHYVDEAGSHHQFTARCDGTIAPASAGEGGFGFDPIFVAAGSRGGRTFAQVTMAEKSTVSHRGKAVRAFVEHLSKAAKT